MKLEQFKICLQFFINEQSQNKSKRGYFLNQIFLKLLGQFLYNQCGWFQNKMKNAHIKDDLKH